MNETTVAVITVGAFILAHLQGKGSFDRIVLTVINFVCMASCAYMTTGAFK